MYNLDCAAGHKVNVLYLNHGWMKIKSSLLKIYNSSDTTLCSSSQAIPIDLLDLVQTFYNLQKDHFGQFFLSLYLTTGNCIEHG